MSIKAFQKGAKYVQLSDGMRMAYQEWGVNNPKRIIAVHGWLDNSNSFNFLGPYLADKGYHCVAIDNIGHGLSDHLGKGAAYSILKSMACFTDFVYSFGWEKFHLIGHSMGTSISMMFASTMHEFVDKLVLIEGLGPVTIDPKETARNLRKALDSERRMRLKDSPPKPYPTFAAAIEARIQAVASYPGSQFLSKEAAEALVARAAQRMDDASEDYQDLVDPTVGPVSFRHDKRLVLPSYMYHSNDQVMAYVNSITAQTLLITSKHGWPLPHEEVAQRRVPLLARGILTHVETEGSHHVHLDPDTRGQVAEIVGRFLAGPQT